MPLKFTSTPQTGPTTAKSLGALLKSARDTMRKDKGLNGDLDRLPMLTWIMFLKFLDDLELQREEEAKLAGIRFRPAIDRPYRWRDWAASPRGITGDELLAFINQDECTRPDGRRGAGLFAYLRSLTGATGDNRRDVIATVFKGVDNRMRSGYLLRDVINKVNSIHFTSSEKLHTLGALYESMLREMRDAAGDSGEFYTPRPVVRFMVEVTDPRLGETVLDPAAGTGGFLVEAFNHLFKQVRTVNDRKLLQERSLSGFEPKSLPYLLCHMNLLLHGLDAPKIDPGNALRYKLTEIGERERVDVILTNPPFGGEEEVGIQANFPDDLRTAETALLFLQMVMRRLKRSPTVVGRSSRAAVVVPESVLGDAGVAAKLRKQLVDEYHLHTIVRLPKGVFEPYSDIQTNLLFFDRAGQTDGIWYVQHEAPDATQGLREPAYTRTKPLRFEELAPLLKWWPKRSQMSNAWFVPRKDIVDRGYSLDFRNPRLKAYEGDGVKAMVNAIARELEGVIGSVRSVNAQQREFGRLLQSSWDRKPLRTFLTRARHDVSILSNKKYKQITVKLYGKGAILRKTIKGGEIKTRPQFKASAGQLIISRIDARNGAFAVVPNELDGAIVTQDFPLFDVDEEIINPEFLALLMRSRAFVEACKRSSRGTTNRKRLNEAHFLEESVPIPPKDVQRRILSIAKDVQTISNGLARVTEVSGQAIPELANHLFG